MTGRGETFAVRLVRHLVRVPVRSPRVHIGVALISGILLVVDYAIALGSGRGRGFDRSALVGVNQYQEIPHFTALSLRIVATIDFGSVALVATAIVAQALYRGYPRQAFAAFAVIGGANATTQILKPLLGALDPFGGDRARTLSPVGLSASFPSGHATVAASIGFAAILAAPVRYRAAAAVVAAAYASAVGVGLVELDSHYPSDVIAACLVCLAWAAIAAAAANSPRLPLPRRTSGRARTSATQTAAVLAILAAGGVFAALLALALYHSPSVVSRGPLHGDFFAAAGAIAAFALVGSLLVFLLRLRDDDADAETAMPDEGWTYCEIAWWRGYSTSRFYARRFAPGSVTYRLARSRLFAWMRRQPPAQAVGAGMHQALVDQLIQEGWEEFEQGEEWYALRFRRRVHADRADEPVDPGSRSSDRPSRRRS